MPHLRALVLMPARTQSIAGDCPAEFCESDDTGCSTTSAGFGSWASEVNRSGIIAPAALDGTARLRSTATFVPVRQ